MKAKMQRQVEPREIAPPPSRQIQIIQGEVEEEIRDFLRAVNSYAARVAKEPRISFRQHLSSIFAARNNEPDRRDNRSRRH
jgi:hypothetical protein